MDKTININLGGTLFTIDEDAYHILRDYLDTIDRKFRNLPGGNETIEDIEYRIAELFRTQSGIIGVITKANVEYVISVIGKPEDFDQEEAGSPSVNEMPPHRKKMYRNPDNTIIGGVCGGIGTYLSTDPVWIRILFVIFAFFFGFGFFVYLALWIAIPIASNDVQRKEMYGGISDQSLKQENYSYSGSKVGHALNEIFKALGKVLFICVRIFLIVFGLLIVITGFLALVTFVIVFIFKYPGTFSTDAFGINIPVPDLLNFIITPKMVPLIKVLIIGVVSLPLLAIIYGGVRMIFWFRARDGFIWLGGFLLWVACAAALSIILFNEGVSYQSVERSEFRESLVLPSDTIYIKTRKKLSDLQTENAFTAFDRESGCNGNGICSFNYGYNMYISDNNQGIYIRPHLVILNEKEVSNTLEIRKISAGKNKYDALENSMRLLYGYKISRDTIYLDDYFAIPANSKWSFDFINLYLYLPKGTIVLMDKDITETIFSTKKSEGLVNESKDGFWKMTSDGLRNIEPHEMTSK